MNNTLKAVKFSDRVIEGAHVIRHADYYHPCDFAETIRAALCNLDFDYSGASDKEMSNLVSRFRKFFRNPQRITRTISIYVESI